MTPDPMHQATTALREYVTEGRVPDGSIWPLSPGMRADHRSVTEGQRVEEG